MPIKVSITDIRSAITKAQGKLDEATASDRDQRILDSQVSAANDRVKSSEAAVTRAEMTKKEAEDKLSPPPTKQIQSDGKKGGTKTVVDEVEKDKLQAQVRAANTQIQQAVQSVDDARAEAERLTGQALDGAGVSSDQQKAMSDLSDLMTDLKRSAQDPQADLEGDEFQNKLKSAVDQIGTLKDSLPDGPNAALKDFWKEITEGMTTVQNKFVAATTPAAYQIATGDRYNNYSEFFGDYNQGMTTLINRLSADGVIDDTTKALLEDSQINVAKHSPSSPDGKYLEGFSADDEKRMTGVMDQVNNLINNLNRDRDITGDDITKLINDSNGLGSKLASGGSNFSNLMTVKFNTLAGHTQTISRNLQLRGQTDDLQDFNDAVAGFSSIANPRNFVGLTERDFQAFDAIDTRVREMARTLSGGGNVSDDAVRSLINDTNDLVDTLKTNYGLVTTNNSGNSSGNGSGVGAGSTSGSAGSSIVGARR